jgi:hypothetical protein
MHDVSKRLYPVVGKFHLRQTDLDHSISRKYPTKQESQHRDVAAQSDLDSLAKQGFRLALEQRRCDECASIFRAGFAARIAVGERASANSGNL